jgi:hypothetical protein
MSYMEKKMLLV